MIVPFASDVTLVLPVLLIDKVSITVVPSANTNFVFPLVVTALQVPPVPAYKWISAEELPPPLFVKSSVQVFVFVPSVTVLVPVTFILPPSLTGEQTEPIDTS